MWVLRQAGLSRLFYYNSRHIRPAHPENSLKGILMGELGIFGILHLAALAYAALQIFDSSADMTKKIIWILIVAFLPVVGLIVWFFIGPGTPKK